MKTYNFLFAVLMLAAATTLTLTSCQDENNIISTTSDHNVESRTNQNNVLYPPTSHPYGKSYDEWAVIFWQRLMAFDCATIFSENVFGLNQEEDVFFLSGSVGTYNIDVTIPADKAILTPIINYINDYPCPDPNFEPSQGQSLEDFLQEGAAAAIDLVENIEVTLDGVVLEDMENYRFNSDLFYFTGSADLPTCFDACVTGTPQPAVTDGYYLIFKKMSPGQHTLHLAAEMPAYGAVLDGTFNITVL